MKAILIAEKPSLMREIESAYKEQRSSIPFEIDFLAQAGHLVGLKQPEEIDKKYKFWKMQNFPIDVPYQYKTLPGKNDLIQEIKKAVKSGEYTHVIHAGDPDGEGELLVRLVLDYVGNTLPVKRFWSNDLTHGAIVSALQNLKDDAEYDPVYQAALVRQHTDYQFGMNITGVTTLKLGDLYKLGRVKAPIIKMIVDREHEIQAFDQTSSWKRTFTVDNCEFENAQEFASQEWAHQNLPEYDYAVVTEQKDEVKSHKAPKLFKLSTVQTEAHRRFGISPKQTLASLQTLYEAKLLSYPRTDCEYISGGVNIGQIKNAIAPVVGVPENLLTRSVGSVHADHMYVNDAAIASEGHTAIIPTGVVPNGLSGRDEKIYQLVARRFLAMFGEMKQVRNLSTTAVPGGDDAQGNYVWKESLDVNPGFETILDPDYKVKTGVGRVFCQGEVLQPITYSEKEHTTKPPARYNEGSLIAALDKPEAFKDDEGKVDYKIGTPATRAGIIDDCVKCDYFTKDKKGVFYPTQKAEYVVAQIGDMPLFEVTNSGRLESMLEQVRHGKVDADEIEQYLLAQCVEMVEGIKGRSLAPKEAEDIGICPACGAKVVGGRYGAYCEKKCGMVVSKAFGKTLTDAQVRDLLAGKKVLVRGLKSKAGKNYDAYLTTDGITDSSFVNAAGEQSKSKYFKFKMEFANKRTFKKKEE